MSRKSLKSWWFASTRSISTNPKPVSLGVTHTLLICCRCLVVFRVHALGLASSVNFHVVLTWIDLELHFCDPEPGMRSVRTKSVSVWLCAPTRFPFTYGDPHFEVSCGAVINNGHDSFTLNTFIHNSFTLNKCTLNTFTLGNSKQCVDDLNVFLCFQWWKRYKTSVMDHNHQ